MIVSGKELVAEFGAEHPEARKRLERWFHTLTSCAARNFMELRRTFNSVDQVKGFTIFDVGGNEYRVICVIVYEGGVAVIRNIFTHGEYVKWGRTLK